MVFFNYYNLLHMYVNKRRGFELYMGQHKNVFDEEDFHYDIRLLRPEI